MGLWRRPLMCGFTLLSLVPGALATAQPLTPGARVSLPLREVDLSDGTRRYVVTLTVGGTRIDAGLDSGSTGLRILPGVLAEGDAKPGWRSDTYSYGSGAEYRGHVGRAHVGFAPGVEGDEDVQLIAAVGCAASHPHCPADRVALKDYGIQGDGLPGEGFKAILGLNLSQTTLPNPLTGIGVKRWIIVLPRPGGAAPGELVLNPLPEETAAYESFPIAGAIGPGLHDSIPGCMRNDSSGQTLCGPTVLDTGAPGLMLVQPGAVPTSRIWRDGTPVRLAFMRDGRQRLGYAMEIGRRDQGSHLIMTGSPDARTPLLFTGIAPYFVYDVAYDADRQKVALKPRDAAGAP